MGDVMIRCPNTDQPLSTGIAMPKEAFESSELSDNSVTCPHCGETHTWNKADAWVQD